MSIIPQFFAFLGLLLLFSCASGDDSKELDPVEETRISIGVVNGKQGINVIHGVTTTGQPTVRYLGLIENKGFRSFCPVTIAFNTKGVDGTTIDIGPVEATVNGYTLTFLTEDGKFLSQDGLTEPKNGPERHGCLKPGQAGSFDTGNVALKGPFSDFEYKMCLNGDKEQCQRLCFKKNGERCRTVANGVPLPQDEWDDEVEDTRVPLIIPVIPQEGVDSNGMKTIRLRVQNAAIDDNTIPYDIRLHYTALNDQGRVIGTAVLRDPNTDEPIVLTKQPCGSFGITAENPLACLTHGVSTDDFTINTNTPASQICDGCSYFRIYHSECPLEEGSCPNS